MSALGAWENVREGEYHDSLRAMDLEDMAEETRRDNLRAALEGGREDWAEVWQHISGVNAERLEMWMREIWLGNKVDMDDLRRIADETVETWVNEMGGSKKC